MTSRCTVLTARPAGKQPLAAAQEAAGGRNRWNGCPARADPPGSTQKSRHRPEPLPDHRRNSGPAEVLDRHLHHLRPPPRGNQQNQTRNLTKRY